MGQTAKSDSEKHLQYRRCHQCGCVNESPPSVGRMKEGQSCTGCGKHLAPFYFFDESGLDGVGDNVLLMSLRKEAVGYQPLWGLSAYW